jgi:hypothetical protein
MSKLLDDLAALAETFEEAKEAYETSTDAWWTSLSKEDQERAFYSVVKRIFKGEIVDKRSYRGVLYDVFGFDANMYVAGMDCGYMALHNSIVDVDELHSLQLENNQLKAKLSELSSE